MLALEDVQAAATPSQSPLLKKTNFLIISYSFPTRSPKTSSKPKFHHLSTVEIKQQSLGFIQNPELCPISLHRRFKPDEIPNAEAAANPIYEQTDMVSTTSSLLQPAGAASASHHQSSSSPLRTSTLNQRCHRAQARTTLTPSSSPVESPPPCCHRHSTPPCLQIQTSYVLLHLHSSPSVTKLSAMAKVD